MDQPSPPFQHVSARPLSPFEKVMWRLNRAAPSNFVTVAQVRGALDEGRLRHALDVVAARHPLLQTRVVAVEGVSPVYQQTTLPLPLRVIDAEDEDATPQIEIELNHPLHADVGPLARSVLLRHSAGFQHVLLTLHHLIADGRSGILLVRDLLGVAGGAHVGTQALTPRLADPVPIDQRLHASSRGFQGAFRSLRFIARSATEMIGSNPPVRIRADADAAASERQNRLVSQHFDTAFTAALITRAKAERASVHAALSAAICLNTVQELGAKSAVCIKHRTPVDMRAQLDPPARDEVGMFASMAFYRGHLTGDEGFWSLARDIGAQINAEVTRGTPATVVNLAPKLFRLLGADRLTDAQLTQRWLDRNRTTTGLTNLGRVDIPRSYGRVHLEKLHFAVSPAALGDFTCSALTFNSRLYWNFMLPEPTFSPRRRANFANDTVNCLRNALALPSGD